MAISITIKRHEDGSVLQGVSDGWGINEPCVSIPVSVITSHDDDTLMVWIRDACQYAEKAAALLFAGWLLQATIDESVFGSETHNIILLQRFAGTDDRIDTAIAKLTQLHERSRFRTETKGKRHALASNRDAIFLEIGRRDGFQCQHCNATKDLAIDHIKPLILGGSNDLDNLQILCRTCNSRKSDR
jgi:hypothetical protein